MNHSITNQNCNPTISDGRCTASGSISSDRLTANNEGSGSAADISRMSPPIVQCNSLTSEGSDPNLIENVDGTEQCPPLFNTVILPDSTSQNLPFNGSLSSNTIVHSTQLSNPSIASPNTLKEYLYQPLLRPYTNSCYDPYDKKNYSPNDSVEGFHFWTGRECIVLVNINKRIGTVSLTLRFHCYLTKWEYASLFSQLRKELKSLGIEWIAFGDVTTRFESPINCLHFHFAFDTVLTPDAMGKIFRATCEKTFHRLVRPSDFQTDTEYQAVITRYFNKDKSIFLQYGADKDFSITDKRYVTDRNGSWSKFVRYALKHKCAPHGVDPVPDYYSDRDVKNGRPLIHLFWKYKIGSGTKSLPRLFYSDGWFIGKTHQQQIKHFMSERKRIAKSHSSHDAPMCGLAEFIQHADRASP